MDRKFWAPSPLDTLDGDTTVVWIYHYIVDLFHFLYCSFDIAFIGQCLEVKVIAKCNNSRNQNALLSDG
jgi:hypothetical protein